MTYTTGRSYTASERVEIFHRAISQPSDCSGKQMRHIQGQKVERGNIMHLRYGEKMVGYRINGSGEEVKREVRPY